MVDRITDVDNFFSTTLTAGITTGSTTIPVASTGSLTSPCIITINGDTAGAGTDTREVLLCDGSFTGTSFSTSDRAANSLLPGGPKQHSSGAVVEVRVLAEHIDDVNDRIGGHTHTGGDDGTQVDHGSLGGLNDDDHTQYLLADGSRQVSGDLSVSGNFDAVNGTFSGTLGGGAATVTSLNAGAGTIQTTGTVASGTVTATGYVRSAAGTTSLPGISFTTDTDTGISTAGNQLDFSTGGTNQFSVGSSGAFVTNRRYYFGAVGSNDYIDHDDTSNLYRFYSDGALALTISGTSLVTPGGITMASSITGVDEVQAENGSATDPSYTFTSDLDMGMYLTGAGGSLAFARAGKDRLIIGTDVIICDPEGNSEVFYDESDLSWSPIANAGNNLGATGKRWATTYTNTLVETSDANLKKNIRDIEFGLDFIRALRPVTYEWKDGSSGRPHTGVLAQQVKQVMDDMGMDWGGFQDSTVNIKDTDPDPDDYAEATYGIAFSEFWGPAIKAIQELADRLEVLENK